MFYQGSANAANTSFTLSRTKAAVMQPTIPMDSPVKRKVVLRVFILGLSHDIISLGDGLKIEAAPPTASWGQKLCSILSLLTFTLLPIDFPIPRLPQMIILVLFAGLTYWIIQLCLVLKNVPLVEFVFIDHSFPD